MSESAVEKLVLQQLEFVTGLIREIRGLIGPLETLGKSLEENVTSFRSIFSFASMTLEKIHENGLANPHKIAEIRCDLELLAEQMEDFEGESVLTGLK